MATVILILVVFLQFSFVQAQTPTPDQPPLFPVPSDGIYQGLGEADQTLASIPNLPNPPNINNAQMLFGHVKWLLYGNLASQVAGIFAPVINHLGFYLTMNVIMSAIYSLVYVVATIIKALIWLALKIIQLIDFIAQIVQAVGGGLLGLLGKLLR